MGLQPCISLQEVAGLFSELAMQMASFLACSRMSPLSCSITASGTVPGGTVSPLSPGVPGLPGSAWIVG